MKSKYKTISVSAFFSFNIFVVVWIGFGYQSLAWIRVYANAVGLATRWDPFRGAYREAYSVETRAEYEGLPSVEVIEWGLPKFRRIKFFTNVSLQPNVRDAYLDFLCRTVKSAEGKTPSAVSFTLIAKKILAPEVAASGGSVLDGEAKKIELGRRTCRR